MRIEITAYYTKDGRHFRPGEKYLTDGPLYQLTVPCGCAGAGSKTHYYYNITISGKQYAIEQSFAREVNEADPQPAAIHITDRLAEVGAEPNERFETKRPDNYHPEWERHRFEKVLPQVDFRSPGHAASN